MNKYRLSLQHYVIAVWKEKINCYVWIVGYFLIARIRDSTYTVGLSGWLSMCKGTELRGTQRACSVSQTHFTPTVALTQLAALVSAEHDPGVYLDNNTAVQQTEHPRCTLSVCQVLTCHPCTFYISVIWITWRQFFWQSQYLDLWSYKDYIRSYRDYINQNNQNAQSKKPIHNYMKKGKIIITSEILKSQTYSLY